MEPEDRADGGRRFPALAHVIDLMGRGEVTEGFEALNLVIESGDPDLVPRAVLLHARFLEARGDLDGMVRCYRIAAASGHAEVAPFAAALLGGVLLERGELRAARAAFAQAARTATDRQVRDTALTGLRALPKRRWRWPWQR